MVKSVCLCKVECSLSEFDDILPQGFLALLLRFALTIGYFDTFKEHLQLKMKEVEYTCLQKIQTLISSIAIGCSHIKDINHKLRPYSAGAKILGMARFPEQSQISRFINRFRFQEIQQLNLVLDQLLLGFGLYNSNQKVDIDFDCTGLITYGKTYEFSRKGYFPHKRGTHGYQFSLGATSYSGFNEILYLQLDPGNTHHGARFWDCIYQVAELLGSLDRVGIVRADAINGTRANIKELQEAEISFIIKGNDSRTAQNIARSLYYKDWQTIDFLHRIADLPERNIPNCPKPVRTILIEDRDNKEYEPKYCHLYTSISPQEMDAVEARDYYNKRQTIEAMIKSDKNGLNISNLRTRKYFGIQAFLYLASITHNLIELFRYYVLSDTGLANLGLTELVEKLMDIPAKIYFNDKRLQLSFPLGHQYSRDFFTTYNPNCLSSI